MGQRISSVESSTWPGGLWRDRSRVRDSLARAAHCALVCPSRDRLDGRRFGADWRASSKRLLCRRSGPPQLRQLIIVRLAAPN
jgi:hypothetical protein